MTEGNSTKSDNDSQEFWGDNNEEPEIKTQFQPAYTNDKPFYRIVAIALSAVVVLTIIGAIWLASNNKEIPDAIIALGSTAVGALAGVLAGSSTN